MGRKPRPVTDDEFRLDVVRALERVAALDRLLAAEINRLDEVMTAFELSVANRFVAGNEFRASLSDVQQQMATRRELEAFQQEYRNAHTDLLQVVADLRTNVAVGPTDLRMLRASEDERQGERRGVDRTANVIARTLVATAALVSVVVIVATYLATHHT